MDHPPVTLQSSDIVGESRTVSVTLTQTSMTITLIIGCILVRGSVGPWTIYTFILVMLAAVVAVLISIGRVIVGDRIERIRVRNWPTASANVDIVSVANVTGDARSPSYRATLTYLYRNPGEQMGDYSRTFGSEVEANAWANSYKGETVKVHVDPRDATRSVLREEDL